MSSLSFQKVRRYTSVVLRCPTRKVGRYASAVLKLSLFPSQTVGRYSPAASHFPVRELGALGSRSSTLPLAAFGRVNARRQLGLVVHRERTSHLARRAAAQAGETSRAGGGAWPWVAALAARQCAAGGPGRPERRGGGGDGGPEWRGGRDWRRRR